MYTRTNDNFKSVLGKGYFNKVKDVVMLLPKSVTGAKIKEIDGCYCLDFLVAHGEEPFSATLVDRTGNERFFNRFLIDDFIDQKLSNREYLLQGCKFAMDLAEKLTKVFPSFKFKIIVSFQKGRKYYTKVTFHKIRKGENYLTRNLNDYKDNGLMVIYT